MLITFLQEVMCVHSKTEMSYTLTYIKIFTRIFHPKIGRKIRLFSLAEKKQYFYKKKKSVVDLKNMIYNMDGLIAASSAL